MPGVPALGPGGTLEYGTPPPPPLVGGILVACAHGAPVPPGADAGTAGWFAICMLCTGSAASGSFSHEKSDPKGKCWTTGNFDKTSALNILIMPLLILPQPSLIPEISKRIGECSQKGPFLTSLIKPMAEKYMFDWR